MWKLFRKWLRTVYDVNWIILIIIEYQVISWVARTLHYILGCIYLSYSAVTESTDFVIEKISKFFVREGDKKS